MMQTFRLDVSRVSSFGGVEVSNSDALLPKPYCGDKLVAVFSPRNTGKTASVTLSRPHLVLHIGMAGYVAKVRKAVIGLIAVDMVDFLHRPIASHVKPCEAVGGVGFAINHDVEVASLIGRAASTSRGYARENAGLGIVMHKLAQTLGGKLGHVCLHLGHRGNSGRKVMSLLFALQELDRTHNLHFQPV